MMRPNASTACVSLRFWQVRIQMVPYYLLG
jgi:hypothetical protein